jgi:hypothetical protein
MRKCYIQYMRKGASLTSENVKRSYLYCDKLAWANDDHKKFVCSFANTNHRVMFTELLLTVLPSFYGMGIIAIKS